MSLFCKKPKNQLTGKWLVMYIPPDVYLPMCCIKRLMLDDPIPPGSEREKEIKRVTVFSFKTAKRKW